MIGRILGHYKILDKLGAGGMGEVYLAEDTTLDRQVALKVLPPELAGSQERLERFKREAKTLAALDHPNIVHIYSVESATVGESLAPSRVGASPAPTSTVHFLTMQLVRGERLADLIPDDDMPVERVLELVIPLADALRAAHEKGIIHRDLKPENVMVDEEGRVKILDFGLAKLRLPDFAEDDRELPTQAMTEAGVVLGTMPYMSPEQVQGVPVDPRTDLFSFGILLYEMACGVRPFKGEDSASLISSILRDEPEPMSELKPGLPQRLVDTIHRCLEKDREDRLPSARELHEELVELQDEVTAGHAAVARPRSGRARLGVGARVLIVAFFVLAVAGGAMWLLRGSKDRTEVASQGPQISLVAVLPLENLSGDPGQEYFVDGMTEALIADLAKIRALKVISRTSVMRYKGTTTPLPEIAAELGVDAIVEGSVLRSGERVRITAQLIEAATDQHLWAENYERDLTDILALQGEVARAIAREIQVVLTPQEEERLAGGSTVDPESYEAYLMGQYQLKKETVEGTRAALPLFEEAIAKDPNNALAYAGLAEVYGGWGRYFGSAEEAESKAEAAALKALELDDTLAEAHFALAYVRYYSQWDWREAGREFERALELNPSLSEAHHNYAHYLWTMGRSEEAELENQRYIELDPQWPRPYECMGFHLGIAGQYERAIDYFKRGLEIDPTYYYGHTGLGDTYAQLGQLEEAVESYRTASGLSDDPLSLASLGLAYVEAISGNGSEARRILEQLEADGTGVSSTIMAAVHAALGDNETAFDWLERAYQEKDLYLTHLRRHPWLDPLRDDPRFVDLVRRMNFPT